MLQRERHAAVRGGFTLMEMLVVVAILVVLAGAAVPIYMKYLDDAKIDRAKMDVQTLTQTCQTYYVKHGDYPASLDALTQPPPEGGLPYLEATSLVDPWNRPYQYTAQGQHNAALGKPDIWSLGPRPNDPNGMIGNWGLIR
jgi:general secretion pathway protein G